ncbi:hypothetical protein O181_006084 [Austropuccinia psidii MF-1]|uniref:Uncharacterized protein n=1 Tax=Austropuccinia psidii MF-1 TaxID=1389203 RepID=A0A9Q3BJD8_9BASI|nr:hypothetical protein [Austropuccinia psidii MF-1]
MCWLRGKQEYLKNDKLVPEALSKKASQKQKSRWRKKLSSNRLKTLLSFKINQDEASIFDEPQFCSDTEDENGSLRKLKSPWRSDLFSKLASQLDPLLIQKQIQKRKFNIIPNVLESRRVQSGIFEKEAKVPVGLPENLYSPDYLSKLTNDEKLMLQSKPSIDIHHLLQLSET